MQGYSLQEYYKLIWEMAYFHKFSIQELEQLPYFELELYRDLTADHIQKEKDAENSF